MSSTSNNLPALPQADISIRTSIAWHPDPPSEPTSTLVLTSPGKHFVDIRLLLPIDPSGILTPDRLDWAFAGTSTTNPLPVSLPILTPQPQPQPDTTPRLVASKWSHWVDTRHPDAEIVVDTAQMRIYPDGRSVEVGSMVNPATGVLTPYEEIWQEGEVDPDEGGMVLQTDDQQGGRRRRGMVVRVGRHIQGILRVGEGVGVQRWERSGEHEDGGWEVVAGTGAAAEEEVGDLVGAMEFVARGGGEKVHAGEMILGPERAWRVVEVWGRGG
ncbi:hypothetical protein GE09DRAFT_1253726 [Coniochaeta sp. 2T2.1]|nr:hypothetical protein GE09DRAFT_1253726 [Coniochaeta sp. 2T2.1]